MNFFRCSLHLKFGENLILDAASLTNCQNTTVTQLWVSCKHELDCCYGEFHIISVVFCAEFLVSFFKEVNLFHEYATEVCKFSENSLFYLW